MERLYNTAHPAASVTTSGTSGDAGATAVTSLSTPGQVIVHNGNAAVTRAFTALI